MAVDGDLVSAVLLIMIAQSTVIDAKCGCD
jgi:hypothetical protein